MSFPQRFYALILTQLTHLKTHKREFIILGTILAGMLVKFTLFGNDEAAIKTITLCVEFFNGYDKWNYYYTKYTVSFLRSFLVLILCVSAILITESKRLAVLNIFIVMSMGMDLLSIMSADIYYIIKPYRYLNTYNFKDLYSTYEVLCVIWNITIACLLYLSSTANRYIRRHSIICDSFSIESYRIR